MPYLPEDALSGPYVLDIRLPGKDGMVLGSAAAEVQEFQPEIMRMSVDIPDAPKEGWLCTKKVSSSSCIG